MEPGSLVIVDSTELKVYGRDEWHQVKHDVLARRTWRKLHLAIDEHHQVLACEFTTQEEGGPSGAADPLTQFVTPVDTFIGEGAYEWRAGFASCFGPPAQRSSGHSTAQDSSALRRWRYAT
jgi:hypothetical protein